MSWSRNIPRLVKRSIIPAIIVFVSCMVCFPSAVYEASKLGLNAWWNIVFPALLPFFVSSELLMSYGVIQFMGVILEPVMRPLFNLPGAASFVIAVGYTSGFPISAALAARLRKDRICTRNEAERLMCFTNNSSPLFMLVAVGVGMFRNPRLGGLIALAHYAANLLIGLALRFYKPNEPGFLAGCSSRSGLFGRAVAEMQKAWRANPRPFGKVISDAISSSVNKLLVIGGFVIIFSIIIRISEITGLLALISHTIGLLAVPLGFSRLTIDALSRGFFEITLGTKSATEASVPLSQKLAAASLILGWSGISVFAQVAAMISDTDMKMGLFTVCRFVHSALAGLICYLLANNITVRDWLAAPVTTELSAQNSISWLITLFMSSRFLSGAILAWFVISAVVYLIRSFSVVRFRI